VGEWKQFIGNLADSTGPKMYIWIQVCLKIKVVHACYKRWGRSWSWSPGSSPTAAGNVVINPTAGALWDYFSHS